MSRCGGAPACQTERIMGRLIWSLVLAAVLSFGALGVAAQSRMVFGEGLAAYDAGEYETAAELWRGLAEAGHPGAQSALADLYSLGLGVEANDAAAANWYLRAARKGQIIAQMNLGEFYAIGRGVERDPVHALAWFSLAAGRGHMWARRRHEEVSKAATVDQREAAERLAPQLLDNGD